MGALSELDCPELVAFTDDPDLFANNLGVPAPRSAPDVIYTRDYSGFIFNCPGAIKQREITAIGTRYASATYDSVIGRKVGGGRLASFFLRDENRVVRAQLDIEVHYQVISAALVPGTCSTGSGGEQRCTWEVTEAVANLSTRIVAGQYGPVDALIVGESVEFSFVDRPGTSLEFTRVTTDENYTLNLVAQTVSHFSPNFVRDFRPECFVSPNLKFRLGFGGFGSDSGIEADASPNSPPNQLAGVLCNFTQGLTKGVKK